MQEQWRRVCSTRRRRKKKQGMGGSGLASSLLPFLADGDLQNTQKHSKQLILVFFFLVHESVCFRLDLLFSWFRLLLCFMWLAGEWVSVDGCAAAGGRFGSAGRGEGNEGVSLWFWPFCGEVLKWQSRAVDAPVLWIREAVWRRKGERSAG
jgi:hypothetical protein